MTISKLEKETKDLIYERTLLEDQVEKHLEAEEHRMPKLSALHHLFSLDSPGPHDNPGLVLSSPESTLKWDNISAESVEMNSPVPYLGEFSEDETGSAKNCKGSTVYLYLEQEVNNMQRDFESQGENLF